MDHTASSSPIQQRATQQQPGSGGHILETVETTRGQPSNSFSLPNTKTIELIGEEFVQRMKTEPEDVSSEAAATRPSVVMSVSLANNQEEHQPGNEPATEQQNLVYCNLNDLDFGTPSDNSSFALVSTTQLGETPTTSITTNANQQLLQMVQAVPGLQITSSDKNPYSAVSTILLQGGILQVLINTVTYISIIVCAAVVVPSDHIFSKPNQTRIGCCIVHSNVCVGSDWPGAPVAADSTLVSHKLCCFQTESDIYTELVIRIISFS